MGSSITLCPSALNTHTPLQARRPTSHTHYRRSAPTNLPEMDWWNKPAGQFERYYVMPPAELSAPLPERLMVPAPPHASRRASCHPHAERRSRLPPPFKELEYPLSRSTDGHGEPDRGPRGRFGGFRPVPPCRGGQPVPPAAEKERSREAGRGAGRRTNPAAEAGRGSTHPAAATRSPPSPGAGRASLRRGPRAPLRALRRALRTPPALPGPARSAAPRTLPRRRAVFLAALLLSPSSRALQIPPKRGYAAGGARMLIRTSLPAGIHERRRGKRGGETYSFIALFSPLADEIAADLYNRGILKIIRDAETQPASSAKTAQHLL